MFPLSGKMSWPPLAAATKLLLDRTDAIGLTGTPLLPGTRVMTVSTAMSGRYIGKGRAITVFICVHAITNSRAKLDGVCKNACDGT